MSESADRRGELAADSVITTESGAQYRIVKQLSANGRGFIYTAEGPDGLKCFIQHNRPEAMDRIRNAARAGCPDERFFVWPRDTVASDDTRGYIADLPGKTFAPMHRFDRPVSSGGVRFLNARVMTDAMLHLVSAFHAMHMCGYAFPDVNRGNFLFDPQTGDLRIVDCAESIYGAWQNDSIFGTPGYVAPEILKGLTGPNRCSDLFSLSVLLFRILFRAHPLEGVRSLASPLTPEMTMYRDDPVFMFDPADERNRPDEKLQQYVIRAWELMPSYLREAFTVSLSREALLTKPQKRVDERGWEDVLIRLRNDIMVCPECDGEMIYTGQAPTACPVCGKPPGQLYAFRTDRCKYPIPISYGSALLSANLRYCDIGRSGIREVQVMRVARDHRQLVIRNVSGGPVTVCGADGGRRELPENGLAPLQGVAQLVMADGTAVSVQPLP